MRKLLTALTLLIGGLFTFQSLAGTYSTTDKWFRLTITKKLDTAQTICQLGKFYLYSEEGAVQNLNLAQGSSATGLAEGQYYATFKGASVGINNLFNTTATGKLQINNCANLGNGDSDYWIVITMRLKSDAANVSKYNLYSANDTGGLNGAIIGRAPTAWKLESSATGGVDDWVVVDEQFEETSEYVTKSHTWYKDCGTGSNSSIATPTKFYDLVAPKVCEHKNTAAIEEAVEPTCTEPGRTAGLKCTDCNKVLEASVEIPAKGHLYDPEAFTWDPEVTENDDGYKIFRCTNVNHGAQCEATTWERVKADNPFTGFTEKYWRFTITGTKGEDKPQLSEFALYDIDGNRQNLGLKYEGQSDATKLDAGKYYNPNDTAGRLFDGTRTGSSKYYGDIVNQGYVMRLADDAKPILYYNICSGGDTSSADCQNRAPTTWTVDVSADGVSWTKLDVHNKINTEDASQSGWTIANSTWYLNGGAADQPTAFYELARIRDCAHAHKEVIAAVEPTCTEAGSTAGLKCLDCGKTLETPTVIPAKEHAFDHDHFSWDPEVTDDRDGYKVYSCTNVNRGVQCDATERELVRAYNTFLGFEGKWYRFTITGTKDGSDPEFSEFALYDIDGNRQNLGLTYENQSDATKIQAGKYYHLKDTQGKLFDGVLTTKYYGAKSAYVMHLADNAKPVLQYNICSSSDIAGYGGIALGRAPTAWTLEVSENGSDWTVIDTQVEATSEYTTDNKTWYKNGGNADNPSAFYVLAEPKTDCPHENTAPIVGAKEPTCTEPGTTAGLKCLDCEAILEAPAEISALGHNYDESTFVWDPEATPKQDGWKAHVCTNVISGEVCGFKQRYEFVRAIGQAPYETWVRFTITRKGASANANDLNSIALARFALVDQNGECLNLGLTELKDKDVTAKDLTPGQFFYAGASAGSPVSNLFKDMDNGNEKWFAQKDGLSGLAAEDADASLYQVITMRLNEWANPTGYKLKAADIASLPGRNPISWTIEVSRDGEKWRLADTRTNVTAPTANYTWYRNEDKDSPIFPIPSRGGLTIIVK